MCLSKATGKRLYAHAGHDSVVAQEGAAIAELLSRPGFGNREMMVIFADLKSALRLLPVLGPNSTKGIKEN